MRAITDFAMATCAAVLILLGNLAGFGVADE